MKPFVFLLISISLILYPIFSTAAEIPSLIDKPIALVIENGQTTNSVAHALRVLQEQRVQATFFLSGSFIAQQEGIVRTILAQGHELGNYGMDYRYWGEATSSEVSQELSASASLVARLGGTPHLIKPPYGYYGDTFVNAIAALKQPASVVRGIDTSDWTLINNEAVMQHVRNHLDLESTITVNLQAPVAVAALPVLIQELKQSGYRFVPVSGLNPPDKQQNKLQTQIQSPEKWVELYEQPMERPVVALTFDDGGTDWQVNKILTVLEENKARSTFFLIGSWMADNPGLVRRIADKGHEIANHSYNHPQLSYLSEEEVEREISAWRNTMQTITGQLGQPFFRPPYGDYNRSVSQIVRQTGVKALVMWSVDSRDWTGVAAETMAERVLAQTDNGSIILFHLHGPHTAEALRYIIPNLTNKGYRLVTVGEMIRKP